MDAAFVALEDFYFNFVALKTCGIEMFMEQKSPARAGLSIISSLLFRVFLFYAPVKDNVAKYSILQHSNRHVNSR